MHELSPHRPDKPLRGKQVKALASEAIHAIMLVMVGRCANDADASNVQGSAAKGFATLFRRVFPTLLRLALDLNAVTRQLFQKLVPQLIHWFAKSRAEHPVAAAILDSLSEGLSSSESGPIRAFCAGAVAEFMNYAIKSQTKTQATGAMTLEGLLTRLERLVRHPNRSVPVRYGI